MVAHDTTADKWTPITRERIRAKLEAFVDWQTEDRSVLLKTAAALFVMEMSGYPMMTLHDAEAELCWPYDTVPVPVERVIDVAYRAALRATTGDAGEREFWDQAVIAAATGFAGLPGYRGRQFPDVLVDEAVIFADALLQARRERWAREGWTREGGAA